MYRPTLGLRVLKKKKKLACSPPTRRVGSNPGLFQFQARVGPNPEPFLVWRRQIRLFQPVNRKSEIVDLMQPGGLVAWCGVASPPRQPTFIVTGSEITFVKQLVVVQILKRGGFYKGMSFRGPWSLGSVNLVDYFPPSVIC